MKNKPYTETEKALVAYLKKALEARGVRKFPRDWHLKQLSCARTMLDGPAAPTLEEWQACIDWALAHSFWRDKIDHLARISWLWTQYCLQKSKKKRDSKPGTNNTIEEKERKKQLIRSLYMS